MTLATTEYLRSGKTHADLEAELGVRAVHHPELPLTILNYSQIDSPKTHPVVRECRGLVLHSESHELVARAFARFFNWGEVADEMSRFDFGDFVVLNKEDGSLVLIYHFNGQWRANTRGSFATDRMQGAALTWQEGFVRAMGIRSLDDLNGRLDKSLCYVCEFCSPWNKVIRKYDRPQMYLLAAFRGEHELTHAQVDAIAAQHGDLFMRPLSHKFRSVEEIQAFLEWQSKFDATFEGVVICDRHGHRWKIKSPTYLSLHRMKGDGESLFLCKNLLPFVLSGETEELFCYFPEVRPAVELLRQTLGEWRDELTALWEANKHAASQKEFALAVKHHPLACLLFNARKSDCATFGLTRDDADVLLRRLKQCGMDERLLECSFSEAA